MAEALWYKDAVFYQVYLRAFKDSDGDGHGDLKGLQSRLDYLVDLGVDCIWLMPIYPSPLKDDGYDIADFFAIDPVFGTLKDFKELLNAIHVHGMRLIMDLVMNHTSDQHPWFQAARAERSGMFREYYVWSDNDAKFSEARVIFVDVERSNWAWDKQAGQYYWHRFYASQPDLNYDNPRVRQEMLNIARFWLDLGIDGFRADAVPFLFEREATNCENLPETHAYLKSLRAMMDTEYPGRILLCEANQRPEDVRRYFGNADEFHMGFNFPVMPRLFMAIKKGSASDLREIILHTPPIPDECQWCTFLRNHDELTLEMVDENERAWMWERYAPDPRMRLNLGIRRRLAPLLDNDIRKIRLIHSLLFTLPGSPIIYYGDEIGMGDNIGLSDRNGVRTPMQWDSSPGAGFSEAGSILPFAPVINDGLFGPARVNVADQRKDPGSLWHSLRGMLRARKRERAFGWGTLEWLVCGNDGIAAYRRLFDDQRVLAIHNLTDASQLFEATVGYSGQLNNILGNGHYESRGNRLRINLSPFEYLWLRTA